MVPGTPHPGNDADTLQTLKMVTEQNGRLSKMVKTLLDMSELQTVSRDETIAVDALVDEVLVDLEPLAQEKEIKLIGNCKDTTMVGSDILIYRMVYNLVENAIKYTVNSTVVVDIGVADTTDGLRISVRDNGIGISSADKKRIFDKFYRSPNIRHISGLGLGLSISKGIVEVHGGKIFARNRPDGGLSIFIHLPCQIKAEKI